MLELINYSKIYKNGKIGADNINLKIEKGNLVFSPFLVLQSLNNRIRPHIPVLITHKLEKSLSRIMPFLFNIDNIKILIATQSPEGNAFEITCLKKFPLTLSLFGSKAKINDGIPIVTTLIRLNWIGIKG